MSIKHSLFVLRFASWYLTSLSTTLQLYRGGQFYWWRKPPTYRKSLTHFITLMLYRVPLTINVIRLTTLVVIGTYYTGSCKSNYNTITTTTGRVLFVYIGSNTYCVVFLFIYLRLVYPMLPVSLGCPFLIAPSVFSNVYLMKEKPPLYHISYFVMTGSCTFFRLVIQIILL